MTPREANPAADWVWTTARILSFGAVAVLLPPGLNLLGFALGWAVILVERGRSGVPLGAMWTMAAILLNLLLHARLTGGAIG